MSEIPEDVMHAASTIWNSLEIGSDEPAISVVARAIIAERQRCIDWCDKVAFLEWEQGEMRAQRALNIARDNIISGDDA